jgi:hypothetical protein
MFEQESHYVVFVSTRKSFDSPNLMLQTNC